MSKIQREYRLVLNDKYIQVQNKSTYDPQPKNQEGPGSLARILADAGAVDVRERVLKFDITAPISPEQFWELRSETSGTLREKLATLPPPRADLLAPEAQGTVREFIPNNQMSIPAQMIIVTVRKS